MWVERNGSRLVSAACLLFCPYLTGSCLFISADDQGSGWACYLGRSGEGLTFPLNITESGVGREARSQTHAYLNESLQSVILMHWITWRCAYLTYIILLTYILFPCCALSLQHTHTHTLIRFRPASSPTTLLKHIAPWNENGVKASSSGGWAVSVFRSVCKVMC